MDFIVVDMNDVTTPKIRIMKLFCHNFCSCLASLPSDHKLNNIFSLNFLVFVFVPYSIESIHNNKRYSFLHSSDLPAISPLPPTPQGHGAC